MAFRGEQIGYGEFDPTYLAAQGKVFYATEPAMGDTVLSAATSFAATTPTFVLDVPAGVVAIPLMMSLCQAGTVAGGAVSVVMEYDNTTRRASGGTAEAMHNARADLVGVVSPACTFYTNPTGNNVAGHRVFGVVTGQDVSPAEGAVQEIVWTPAAGLDFLVGPASWMVHTWAASTAPTWLWTFKWAEIPVGAL